MFSLVLTLKDSLTRRTVISPGVVCHFSPGGFPQRTRSPLPPGGAEEFSEAPTSCQRASVFILSQSDPRLPWFCLGVSTAGLCFPTCTGQGVLALVLCAGLPAAPRLDCSLSQYQPDYRGVSLVLEFAVLPVLWGPPCCCPGRTHQSLPLAIRWFSQNKWERLSRSSCFCS